MNAPIPLPRETNANESSAALSAQVDADCRLVERCLSGDSGAWSELYHSFHHRLLASIRPVLGPMANDGSLIDEIGARVWYLLVRNDFELLARFDVNRGCQLSTFLGIIAKREAKQLLRSEQRRRIREHGASRPDRQHQDSELALNVAIEEEFKQSLTSSERAFYDGVLTGSPEDGQPQDYSPSNAWQLTHRVREKLAGFLSE